MGWIDQVEDVLVMFCTVPTEDVGTELAKALVNEGLASCVNVVPGLRSIYRWKGEVCDEPELLLIIKSDRRRAEALSQRVEELHPYETPELIALPVKGGLDSYLTWVRD